MHVVCAASLFLPHVPSFRIAPCSFEKNDPCFYSVSCSQDVDDLDRFEMMFELFRRNLDVLDCQ